jgi:hypothetical protein
MPVDLPSGGPGTNARASRRTISVGASTLVSMGLIVRGPPRRA